MKEYSSDPRYGAVKVLIETGHIRSVKEIFLFILKTTVYKDLGVNYNRFDRAILDLSIFRLKELTILAELFGVDSRKFVEMAFGHL